MCEPQCEDCDYDCVSELLNSAVDSACMDIAKQYSSGSEQTMDNAYEAATSVINGFVVGHTIFTYMQEMDFDRTWAIKKITKNSHYIIRGLKKCGQISLLNLLQKYLKADSI